MSLTPDEKAVLLAAMLARDTPDDDADEAIVWIVLLSKLGRPMDTAVWHRAIDRLVGLGLLEDDSATGRRRLRITTAGLKLL